MQSSEKIVAISKHSPWEAVSVLFAPLRLAKVYEALPVYKALNLLLRWGPRGRGGDGDGGLWEGTAGKSIWSPI